MTDDNARGRFIWHELMTPNPAGARDFYSNVLGWNVEPPEPNPEHPSFTGPSGPLGGYTEQSPSAVPKWIPFVTVVDIERAMGKAAELGAGVVVEPTPVDGGGRYAVLTDPQGAAIGIYSAADFGPERNADPGEFSWHELATTDYRGAFDFYSDLFGWENIAEHDMGPMGIYLVFGRGQTQLGGMFNKAEGAGGEAAWLSYVRVTDLSRTLEKARSARGSLLSGPMEVPGGDWIAHLLDPYGAAFALHTVAADVKGAEPRTAGAARADASRDTKSEEAQGGKAPRRRAAKSGAQKPQTQASDAGAVTEIWSTSAGAEPSVARKASKKKASAEKAAKSNATKKKSKKAGSKAGKSAGQTTAKKAAKKRPTKKKAATKKAGAKKTGAKKGASKKAAKKAGKKTGKKTAKKSAKASGKTARKKPGKKKPGRKTPAARTRAGSRRKSGKTSSGAKPSGKKQTGKKAKKRSGRR